MPGTPDANTFDFDRNYWLNGGSLNIQKIHDFCRTFLCGNKTGNIDLGDIKPLPYLLDENYNVNWKLTNHQDFYLQRGTVRRILNALNPLCYCRPSFCRCDPDTLIGRRDLGYSTDPFRKEGKDQQQIAGGIEFQEERMNSLVGQMIAISTRQPDRLSPLNIQGNLS